MKPPPPRGILVALAIAVPVHLLLFVLARPPAVASAPLPNPPKTRYLFQSLENAPRDAGSAVRVIQSPVLFSLPTSMGFSRELSAGDVRTRLTFSKKAPSERFLEVDSSAPDATARLNSQGLMLSASGNRAPQLPVGVFQTLEPRADAPRVVLAPELDARLKDAVVFSADLNEKVSKPWEVRAAVSVSEQGVVQHVFVDRPLDSAPRNQQVLQLLYGLRFTPGSAMEGVVELYSPKAADDGGDE